MNRLLTVTLTAHLIFINACSQSKMTGAIDTKAQSANGSGSNNVDSEAKNADPSKVAKPSTPPSGGVVDTIEIPVNITGAQLRCAEESIATEQRPQSLYGCRVADKDGNWVPKVTTSRLEFGFAFAKATTFIVSVKPDLKSERYDAFYIIGAQTLTEYKTQLESVSVRIKDPAAIDQTFAVENFLSATAYPAVSFPTDPTPTDYDSIKDSCYTVFGQNVDYECH